MEHTTHYSAAQRPVDLGRWAKEAAASLVARFGHGSTRPVLVYRGMSGVASATALSLALTAHYPDFKFGMMYVRKDEEKSHGRKDYEASWWASGEFMWEAARTGWVNSPVAVFVDDCIDSGKTMMLCEQAAARAGCFINGLRTLSNQIYGGVVQS